MSGASEHHADGGLGTSPGPDLRQLSLGRRVASSTGKDSLRSWLACAATCWVTFCFNCFLRTMNIVFQELARVHNLSRGSTFDMCGMVIIASCISGTVVSYLNRWISSRTLICGAMILSTIGLGQMFFDISHRSLIILGALYGIGWGTHNNQLPVVLSRHFDRHRTKAVDFQPFGSDTTELVRRVLTEYMSPIASIETPGWHGGASMCACLATGGAIRVQRAGLCLSGFVFSAVMRKALDNFGVAWCFMFLALIVAASLIGAAFLTVPEVSSDVTDETSAPSTGRIATTTTNQRGNLSGLSCTNETCHPLVQDTSAKVVMNNCDGTVILSDHRNPENGPVKEGTDDDDLTAGAIFRSVMFYPMLANTFTIYLHFCVFALALDLAHDRGINPKLTSYVNLIYAFIELISYLGIGFITKEDQTRTRNVLVFCQMLGACVPYLFSTASSFAYFAFLQAVYGFTNGSITLLNVILMRQYLGEKLFPRALGTAHFSGAIAYLLMSPLIRYYRDVVGTYEPLMAILSGVLLCLNLTWLLEAKRSN